MRRGADAQACPCGFIQIRSSARICKSSCQAGAKFLTRSQFDSDDRGKARVVFKDNAKGQFVDWFAGARFYGGLWTENVVSGIARDLLVEAMLRVEAADFPITMTVHDEIVAEIPGGADRTREFLHLLTRKPAWAQTLPIAASVWSKARV